MLADWKLSILHVCLHTFCIGRPKASFRQQQKSMHHHKWKSRRLWPFHLLYIVRVRMVWTQISTYQICSSFWIYTFLGNICTLFPAYASCSLVVAKASHKNAKGWVTCKKREPRFFSNVEFCICIIIFSPTRHIQLINQFRVYYLQVIHFMCDMTRTEWKTTYA